jgi:hypothetical protein
MDEYLAKPVTLDALRKTLVRVRPQLRGSEPAAAAS